MMKKISSLFAIVFVISGCSGSFKGQLNPSGDDSKEGLIKANPPSVPGDLTQPVQLTEEQRKAIEQDYAQAEMMFSDLTHQRWRLKTALQIGGADPTTTVLDPKNPPVDLIKTEGSPSLDISFGPSEKSIFYSATHPWETWNTPFLIRLADTTVTGNLSNDLVHSELPSHYFRFSTAGEWPQPPADIPADHPTNSFLRMASLFEPSIKTNQYRYIILFRTVFVFERVIP